MTNPESMTRADLLVEVDRLQVQEAEAIAAIGARDEALRAFAEVTQQRDLLRMELENVDDALDGQFPHDRPCVARGVQQQREALDTALRALGEANSAYIDTQFALVEAQQEIERLRAALKSADDALPDSLGRPMTARIALVLENMRRESHIGCELRRELDGGIERDAKAIEQQWPEAAKFLRSHAHIEDGV